MTAISRRSKICAYTRRPSFISASSITTMRKAMRHGWRQRGAMQRVDGVATECGMARGDPARLPSLLAAHVRAAQFAVS